MYDTMYYHYTFKPSYLAYVVHGIAFLMWCVVLYMIVSPIVWGICVFVTLMCSIFFLFRQTRCDYLGYLDHGVWTLQSIQHKTPVTEQLKIIHMLDHLMYIVVYFDPQHKHKPLVIWRDQVDILHWKGLKTRAMLGHFN